MAWLPSILHPTWLLLALPALLGIAYAYLRSQQGKQLRVGSTFLLERIARRSQGRRKFLPPLRFFVECLLASALIACLAGLLWHSPQQRYFLILDNSLSTDASAEESVLGTRTRVFDKLLIELEKFIHKNSSAEHIVLTTASSCSLENSLNSTKQDLEKALQKIEVLPSSDDLESCVRKIARVTEGDALHIFSDRKIEQNTEESLGSPVVGHFFGLAEAERKNLSFLHPFLNKDAQNGVPAVEFSIKHFRPESSRESAQKARGTLEIFGVQESSQDISEKVLATRPFEIEEGSERAFRIPLPETPVLAYRVALSTKDWKTNRILEDDQFFLMADSKSDSVRIISRRSRSELGLNSQKAFLLSIETPDDFEKEKPSEDYSLSVFHEYVPGSLPAGNIFLIAPAPGNPLLPVGEPRRNLPLTYIASAHPIARYVEWDLFHIAMARPLRPEPWAKDILRSSSSLLLYAGERDGRRIAVSAFDLFPFEGRKDLGRSLLTLNLFRWLTESKLTLSGRPGQKASSKGFFVSTQTNEKLLEKNMRAGEVFFGQGLFRDDTNNTRLIQFSSESESSLQQGPIGGIHLRKTKKVEGMSSQETFVPYFVSLLIGLYLFYWLFQSFTKAFPKIRMRKGEGQ